MTRRRARHKASDVVDAELVRPTRIVVPPPVCPRCGDHPTEPRAPGVGCPDCPGGRAVLEQAGRLSIRDRAERLARQAADHVADRAFESFKDRIRRL